MFTKYLKNGKLQEPETLRFNLILKGNLNISWRSKSSLPVTPLLHLIFKDLFKKWLQTMSFKLSIFIVRAHAGRKLIGNIFSRKLNWGRG